MTATTTQAAAGAAATGAPGRRPRRRGAAGLAFTTPALVMVLVFFFVPLGLTVFMSFQDWPLLGEVEPNGVANYTEAAVDGQFRESLWFTIRYTVVITVASFVVGFALATLVKEPLRGVGIFRSAFFVPVVTGLAATSFLWSWMYNQQVGVFSAVLRWLGVVDGPVGFLSSSNAALLSVCLMMVWKTSGFIMLIMLIGMQSISSDIYESARIDGAGRWATLRHITVPLLRRPMALTLVLTVTGGLLAFEQWFITTRGGPDNTTITVVSWLYNQAFVIFRLGYAAALAMLLLVVIVAINIVQLLALRKDPA